MIPVINDDPSCCMKCGFCMSACPVYNIDKRENHVARGRNVLVQMTKSGRMDIKAIEEALFYCLLCGKCEAVCPAKVTSTSIALKARSVLIDKTGLSLLKRLIFRGLLKKRTLMARLAGLTSLLPGFSTRETMPRHFPDFISATFKGIRIPKFSVPFLSKRISRLFPPENILKGKTAVFGGCIFEYLLSGIGEEMISSIAGRGFKVEYPSGQTCCALPVYASGDFDTAKAMAKRNIEIFSGYDTIITGCASCGSTLKGYANWFSDGPDKDKAVAFSNRIMDYSEFIFKQGLEKNEYKNSVKVTYHDPCHLKWKQGIGIEPREILKNIKGVEYIEMEGADNCCGLGGSFALAHPEESIAIRDKKIDSIKKTGADIVVTACPGCIIQLMSGLRQANLPVKVMHISQMIR